MSLFFEQRCLCSSRKDSSQLKTIRCVTGPSGNRGPRSPDFSNSFPVSDLDECSLCIRLWRTESGCFLALLIGHMVISDPVGQNPVLLFWTEGRQEHTNKHTNIDTLYTQKATSLFLFYNSLRFNVPVVPHKLKFQPNVA